MFRMFRAPRHTGQAYNYRTAVFVHDFPATTREQCSCHALMALPQTDIGHPPDEKILCREPLACVLYQAPGLPTVPLPLARTVAPFPNLHHIQAYWYFFSNTAIFPFLLSSNNRFDDEKNNRCKGSKVRLLYDRQANERMKFFLKKF